MIELLRNKNKNDKKNLMKPQYGEINVMNINYHCTVIIYILKLNKKILHLFQIFIPDIDFCKY